MLRLIVVGTDGSSTAAKAVRDAVDLAKADGAALKFVTAYDSGEQHMPNAVPAREDADVALDQASGAARDAGVQAQIFARKGDAADAIIEVAEAEDADLIVVGSKGMTGAKRFLLGSVPNKVSHHAPCSVLIVRTV